MTTLFKLAVTAILGVAIIIAYRVYQKEYSSNSANSTNTNTKKKKQQRKLNRHSDKSLDSTASGAGAGTKKKSKVKRILRATNSDILHPAPFDNVNGVMKIGEKQETSSDDSDDTSKILAGSTNSKTAESAEKPEGNTEKAPSIIQSTKQSNSDDLSGSRTTSEILSIQKNDIVFNDATYIQAQAKSQAATEKSTSGTAEPLSPNAKRGTSKRRSQERLSGDRTDSEIQEINQNLISFNECTYVKATGSAASDESLIKASSPVTSKTGNVMEQKKVDEVPPPVVIAPPPKNREDRRDAIPTTAELLRAQLASPMSSAQNLAALPPQIQPPPPPVPGSSDPLGSPKIPSSPCASVEKTAVVVDAAPPPATAPAAAAEGSAPPVVPPPGASPTPNALAEAPKSESKKASASTSRLSSESINSNSMFRICQCRKRERADDQQNDAEIPRFNPAVKPEIAPIEVIPALFSKYQPQNLLEPSGNLKQLPLACFDHIDKSTNTYLTPLLPVLNSIHASHSHACLIKNLVDNYEFFE